MIFPSGEDQVCERSRIEIIREGLSIGGYSAAKYLCGQFLL